MRNKIVVAENHVFSGRMFSKFGEIGHFISKCCENPKAFLEELNLGKMINRPGDIRHGASTRPLCNDSNWRITTLIEFNDSGTTGDYIVSLLRDSTRKPKGMKRVEKMLKLDDQIRFESASILPLIGNGIKGVSIPREHLRVLDQFRKPTLPIYIAKTERDELITSTLADYKLEFSQLI